MLVGEGSKSEHTFLEGHMFGMSLFVCLFTLGRFLGVFFSRYCFFLSPMFPSSVLHGSRRMHMRHLSVILLLF